MPKSPFTTSRNIYIFKNIQTSQTIISPTAVLDNSRSLSQLPRPNRRLAPPALRKDHWIPLLKARFPTPDITRGVYSRLLEYRTWRTSERTDFTIPSTAQFKALRKSARARLFQDQVGVSIADLAAVAEGVDGPVEVSWLEEGDKGWAERWSGNVVHRQDLQVLRGFRLVETYLSNPPVPNPSISADSVKEEHDKGKEVVV